MQRQEHLHHTPEQIEGYARMAKETAERIFTEPEDVRAVLPTLIGLYSAKQIIFEQVEASPLLAGLHRNAIGR